MTDQELYIAVTASIARAERARDTEAIDAWLAVAVFEKMLAARHPLDSDEGRTARKGVITALLNADQLEQAIEYSALIAHKNQAQKEHQLEIRIDRETHIAWLRCSECNWEMNTNCQVWTDIRFLDPSCSGGRPSVKHANSQKYAEDERLRAMQRSHARRQQADALGLLTALVPWLK